jgi:hypothetical protein
MSIKLAILKSGEDIVADIKEYVDDEGNVVALIFENPVAVKLFSNKSVVDAEKSDEFSVSFTNWIPLSAETTIPVDKDWVVTIVEPVDVVKKSYEERMNGRRTATTATSDGRTSSDASVSDEQSDTNKSD